MLSDAIPKILSKIGLDDSGMYDDHFYVLQLNDSDEYAKIYSMLDANAVNSEYPVFKSNTNKTTTKTINYFEIDIDGTTFNIFLMADFENDKYNIKIGEK